MKTITSIKIIAAITVAAVIFGCSPTDNDEPQPETTATTIKGNISDMQRGFPIANFKLVLVRTESCWSGVMSATCTEVIDSVHTDANGNYQIDFDFIKDKTYAISLGNTPYIIENRSQSGPITEGVTNIVNFNAWNPVILKLTLHVTNNNNAPLRIDSEVPGTDIFGWQSSVFEQTADTVVYSATKPDADFQLNFHYTTGFANSDFHIRKEFGHSTLDTLNLEYSIDCSAF